MSLGGGLMAPRESMFEPMVSPGSGPLAPGESEMLIESASRRWPDGTWKVDFRTDGVSRRAHGASGESV